MTNTRITKKIARAEEWLLKVSGRKPYVFRILRKIPYIRFLDITKSEARRRKVLIIEITSICNTRCVWCLMQSFRLIKPGSMTLEQFTQIIDKNKNYLKDNNFSIEPYFRGEPLLHPNFWEICEVLKRNGIKNGGINTNLNVRTDLDNFLKYEMEGILVNIGGTTKEVHERTMRGSDFELVSNNLKRLWAMEVPARIKMNPTRLNIRQMKDLPGFVESLGGKTEFIMPYTTQYPPIPLTVITQEQLDFFFKNVVSEEVNDYLGFTYNSFEPNQGIRTKTPGCHNLFDTIFFDGQFSICCNDQLQMINLGNVFETTIEKIRHSKEYAQAIETAKKCGFPICWRCR